MLTALQDTEMPLVRILVGMEAMGVGLDAQVYEAQRPPLEKRLTQLQVGGGAVTRCVSVYFRVSQCNRASGAVGQPACRRCKWEENHCFGIIVIGAKHGNALQPCIVVLSCWCLSSTRPQPQPGCRPDATVRCCFAPSKLDKARICYMCSEVITR